MTVRRVITGETAEGTGVFTRVEEVEPVVSHITWWGLWGWDEAPSLPVGEGEQFPAESPFPPLSAPHGVRISMTEFRPEDDPLNVRRPEDEMGRKLAVDRMRERDLESGLHRTDTIDIVFVLRGEITLEESGGESVTLRPGDCLVQNGTMHNWRNTSGEPALLGFVIIAADRAGDAD